MNRLIIWIVALLASVTSAALASELPEESKRYLGELINATYWIDSNWCEVEFIGQFPAARAICNFDIGKVAQVAQEIETAEAIVRPCILIHSEVNAETQNAWIESGEMTSDGRMNGWPADLPDPDGVPAFVFINRNGEIVEGPEDLVIQMQACADYATANETKIEEDRRQL